MAYEPARDFILRRFDDIDGDGRPDLIVIPEPYQTRGLQKNAANGEWSSDPTLLFLAHAVPGGEFRLDDAAAQNFVKKEWCDHAPLDVVRRQNDEAILLGNPLVCARLWGASREQLRRTVMRRCKTFSTREQWERALVRNDDANLREECAPWVPELIDAEPPLRLHEAKGHQ